MLSVLFMETSLRARTPRNLTTALPFPQFALLNSVACVLLKLITVLGNCGCVAVASFLGVPL
jgi:hypothetical protein